MVNQLRNYSFINCGCPYADLINAAYETQVKEDREYLISLVIQYMDFVVFSGTFAFILDPYKPPFEQDDSALRMCMKSSEAFDAIRYCLRDPLCQDQTWTWLQGKMACMDPAVQDLMVIKVFCPILTPPIDWDDPYEMISVDRLLWCFHDPARKWAVLEGFTECTFEIAMTTLHAYEQWCAKSHRDPASVDATELRRYLNDYGWDENACDERKDVDK